MSDSIEKVIDAMEHDASDIRRGRDWMAACEHYATRLRALTANADRSKDNEVVGASGGGDADITRLKRYDFDNDGVYEEYSLGEWVRYDDVESLLATPASPAGGDWVMVPREPTAAMLRNAYHLPVPHAGAEKWLREDALKIWNAMLAASPQQEPGACPHIVQSKEGTAYCRLAESAGASGGGVECPRCDGEGTRWNNAAMEVSECGRCRGLGKIADRVEDLCTAWGDEGERAKRDAIAKELRQLTPASPAAPQPQANLIGYEDGSSHGRTTPPAHGDGEVVEHAARWMRLLRDATSQEHEIAMLDAILAALATRHAPEAQASGQTLAGAGVYGLRQGNWSHPDGGRIVGWVVEPDDVERMKADAFCLPRELAECLVNLRNAHRTLTATSAGGGVRWVIK